MHLLLRGVLVFVFTFLLCCTSCAAPASSVSLTLPADMQEAALYPPSAHTSNSQIRYAPLKALNKNAQAGIISDPEKSNTMYFAFEKNPDMLDLTDSGLYALELEFEPLTDTAPWKEPDAVQTGSAEFTVGLLYASDFSASGNLKGNIQPQHPVTARTLPYKTFTVSIGFAGIAVRAANIRGFMVSAQKALKLKRAAVVPVRYGWLKNKTALWYGAAADGGLIPPELCVEAALPFRTELPKPSALIRTGHTGSEDEGRDSIVIHFDETLPVELTTGQKQPRLSFQCGDKSISVYRAPKLYRLTLDGSLFPDAFLTIEQTDMNTRMDTSRKADTDTDEPVNTDGRIDTADSVTHICGIIAEYSKRSLPAPITADPGLILDWPQEQWRQPSYELFAWEQFPSVLIFDFADYSVQDSYLKRLSFFAEKRGFAGRLLFDEELTALHGFNAHDYSAETLAAFFQKAEKEHFPLSKSELHLRKILFHNGIIARTEQGIEAGNGAIVSISRQSPAYLRYRFITHECLHGIYFTEESFRNTVAKAFQQTDPRAILFLRHYFEVYPTLQYNTDDEYLLQNEFMAYLLQQDSSALQQYYNRISWFQIMNKTKHALCKYIRKTNAKDFMLAASQMSSFLYTAWGIKSGRIHLAEIEAL